MRAQGRTVDQEIARLASQSHGVVTRKRLLGTGVTRAEIESRLRSGALIGVHPGVFRVGHRAPSAEATYLAAVWACGEGALLCDLAAAHLLGLVREAPREPQVRTWTERHIDGIQTRRTRDRTSLDAWTWRGVPCTRVARTLIDLAAILDEQALARACHEARVKHGTRPEQVMRVLARRPNTPGAQKLKRVLLGDTRLTLSDLEDAFLELMQEHGLPLPITNRVASGRYVDCRWADHHLTVELDSYTYHATRHAWERDRRREREAYARGDEFRRYTYGDVTETPATVVEELEPKLRRRRSASRPSTPRRPTG